jgi:LacI family transcriptional regulator
VKKNKVSLNDLAKELNLSKTLISMVLNGKGDTIKISKATQKRVLDKAKELKYAPNQFARALRLGKSFTIGLIVPDITNPFYARLALVLENELRKQHYTLLICNTGEDAAREVELIRNLQARAVEGIFLASCQNNPQQLIELSSETLPLILVDRIFENCPLHSFSAENKSAGEKVADYFLKADVKKIAVFGLKPISVSSISNRLKGFTDRLKKKGNYIKNQIQIFEIDPEHHLEEIKKILEPLVKKKNIEGIFALNNVAAVAVLKAMKSLKDYDPKNISFFSFDDLDAFELCSPKISAVEQPIDEMGSRAVSHMLSYLDGGDLSKTPIEVQLPVKIKIRESLS